MSQEVSKWLGYNLLINGVYWGYNPFTNHFLTSWDIQVLGTASFWQLKSEKKRKPLTSVVKQLHGQQPPGHQVRWAER